MTGPQFWLTFLAVLLALATLGLLALIVGALVAGPRSMPCPSCGGSGCRIDEEGGVCLAAHPDDGLDHGPCSTCDGSGVLS